MIAISSLHHETGGRKKNPAADLIDKLLAIPKGKPNGREHARGFPMLIDEFESSNLKTPNRTIPLSHHPWGD
jgi:hypothetical protein